MKRFFGLLLLYVLLSLALSGCYIYTKEPPPEPVIIISPDGPPPPPPPPAGAVGPAPRY